MIFLDKMAEPTKILIRKVSRFDKFDILVKIQDATEKSLFFSLHTYIYGLGKNVRYMNRPIKGKEEWLVSVWPWIGFEPQDVANRLICVTAEASNHMTTIGVVGKGRRSEGSGVSCSFLCWFCLIVLVNLLSPFFTSPSAPFTTGSVSVFIHHILVISISRFLYLNSLFWESTSQSDLLSLL